MTGEVGSRSAAVREQLITYVAMNPARSRRRLWTPALFLAGAILGGGVATSAFAVSGLLGAAPAQPSGQPTPDLPPAVAAPAGIIPGATIISLVGEPISVSLTDDIAVPLPDNPALSALSAATHVRVTITALSTGDISFGTDPAGNNPSASWSAADEIGTTSATTQYDFPLDDTIDAIYLRPHDFNGIATVQLITQIPTDFGVNEHGQTFGVTGSSRGEPDLIAVVATNGAPGYVLRRDLEDADGTAAAEGFTSPGDAAEWQESQPDGVILLPVYESNGTTVVGEFAVETGQQG